MGTAPLLLTKEVADLPSRRGAQKGTSLHVRMDPLFAAVLTGNVEKIKVRSVTPLGPTVSRNRRGKSASLVTP